MPSSWIRVGCSGLLAWAGACTEEASEAAPSSVEAPPEPPPEPQKAAPREAEAPPAPEPIVPTGHGVVRVGGALYPTATSTTPVVVPDLGRYDGATVDIVGEEKGRLVVETLGGAAGQHHCAGELSGLSDLRLRLYIDPADLHAITTAPVEVAFADGTKIALSAGVPVGDSDGTWRANPAGTVIVVEVPEASRGTFHEPGEARSSEGALGKLHEDGDPPTPLRFGDGATLPEPDLFRDGLEPAHYGVTSKDGDAFVTVRNACLEAIVRTSTARLMPSVPPAVASAGILGTLGSESGHFLAVPYGSVPAADEDIWGGLTGTEIGEAYGVGGLGLVGSGPGAGGRSYTARVGAPIHWEDGTVAGQVLSARDLAGPPREVGGRTCFDVKLVSREDAALSLCFSSSDLEEKESTGAATIGLGTYGIIGRGSSSGGFGGRGKRVPTVRQAKAEVKGSLDKDIIRRIVRAHINEVRYCYNQLLVKEPTAEGKVTIAFTIEASGNVTVASASDNTTGNENVAQCIEKAVKRWKFPKPSSGGTVTVSYPFVLAPA